MLDFGALPPEITSARMYSGPGSGPMMAAAAAWDAVAGQLASFAAGYSEALSELRGATWSGSASAAMAGAATPYLEWAAATAAQAEQTAGQARAAAAAYETAFAATVPPVVVAANRIQLAVLVATNFFGQNTPLIAANEAAYAAMWSQDAAAMFGYAASSAAALDITAFHEPPQTTNSAGHAAQAAAVAHAAGSTAVAHSHATLSQLLSAAAQQLHTPSTTGSSGSSASQPTPVLTVFADFNILSGPMNFVSSTTRTAAMTGDFANELNLYGLQLGNVAAVIPAPAATTGAVTAGPGHRVVLANVGRAESVGRLSAPQTWSTTAASGPAAKPPQQPKTAFRALPPWAGNAGNPAAGGPEEASTAGLGPTVPAAARPGQDNARRMQVRRFRMPRPAVGG